MSVKKLKFLKHRNSKKEQIWLESRGNISWVAEIRGGFQKIKLLINPSI